MLPGETNEQQQNLINAEKAEYSENSPHSIIARPDSLQTTKMRHSKLKKERKHPVTTNRCALKGTEMFGSGDWSPAVTRSRQPFSLCPWSYSQSAYACQTCVTEFDIFVVTRGFVFGGGSFSYTVWSCWKRCGKKKPLLLKKWQNGRSSTERHRGRLFRRRVAKRRVRGYVRNVSMVYVDYRAIHTAVIMPRLVRKRICFRE